MKALLKYIAPVLVAASLNAQQSSLFNTYALDPLQLNIAYAGSSCSGANLHYRTQWIGLKETPKTLQLNAHTALGQTNAVALRVNSQTMGLLNTLGATVGYSYRFRVSQDAKVHLGIGVGWSQASLNAQKAVVIDANDGTLANNNKQTANGFDSEFGAMLLGKKIKAGVSALHLYNSNPDFTGSGYKMLPQLNSMVAYTFNKDSKVEIEPWLLDRYTINGNHVLEGMVNVNLFKTLTAGVGYRSNYGMLVLLGAKIGSIRLAYSFDYGGGKNATNLGTSHQVMLGFALCKHESPAVPPPAEEEPVAATQPTVLPTVTDMDPKPVQPEPARLDAVPEDNVSYQGKLMKGEGTGAPLSNTKVKIMNEKGEVVGETTTNNSGAFVFRSLKGNENYLIQVDEPSLPDGTRITLTNKQGKEVKSVIKNVDPPRFNVITSDKSQLNDMKADDASLAMNLTGHLYDQDMKPISGAHISIREEDGSNEQKIVTDGTGKFNCANLDAEKTYLFEADENDPAFAGVSSIKFANLNGKVYRVIDMGKGKFSFKLLESDKVNLGEFRVEDIDMSMPDKVEPIVAKVEPPAPPVKADDLSPDKALEDINVIAEEVVFEFNKTQLGEEGQRKLDKVAAIMNSSPRLRINVIGHTCNIGTKEANNMVSIRRATYVRNELIKRGVNPKNIDRSIGIGADQALFDNGNAETQRKNRTIRFESVN